MTSTEYLDASADISPLSTDVLVVGNCIAAMVSALDLSMRGVDVIVVNPTSNWGGHFSSKTINGLAFDLGMVGFEFTGFHSSPSRDLASYNPRIRNDVARFCQLAKEYVESLIPVNRAQSPLMLWNGVLHPDVLMGNDLSVMKHLPEALATSITMELMRILDSQGRRLHASTKSVNQEYVSASYEEASIANHGNTFHELFITPFADRLFPGGAGRFSALYHRCLWMPLYYPESLLAAMGSDPHDLTTLFHYPSAGHIGSLAENLLLRLKSASNVRIIGGTVAAISKGGRWDVRLKDGKIVQAEDVVWGLDLVNLMRAGIPNTDKLYDHSFNKATATFGFFAVDRNRLRMDFSSLFIMERSRLIYRACNLSNAGNTDEPIARLVLECDSQSLESDKTDNMELKRSIISELVALGIIDDESVILSGEAYKVQNIMPIPDKHDHDHYWRLYDMAKENFPELKFVGPSGGYLITTMNDQIVQGLQASLEIVE